MARFDFDSSGLRVDQYESGDASASFHPQAAAKIEVQFFPETCTDESGTLAEFFTVRMSHDGASSCFFVSRELLVQLRNSLGEALIEADSADSVPFRLPLTGKEPHALIQATYLDCSGSMEPKDYPAHQAGMLFFFDVAVHNARPTFQDGTDFGCVVKHAREQGFSVIRIVTDGFADRIEPGELRIDWVIVKQQA